MHCIDKRIDEIVNTVVDFFNGRKIVCWGDCYDTQTIEKVLRECYDLSIYAIVDGDSSKWNNRKIFSPEILKNKAPEIYVIVPLAFHQSIMNALNEYGYSSSDYCYFCNCIVTREDDYFEDEHHNRIFGYYDGVHVFFAGYNGTIYLKENIKCNRIIIGSNSCINLDEGAHIEEIKAGDESDIYIGKDTYCKNISVPSYVKIDIGSDCYLDIDMMIAERTAIKIGNTCHIPTGRLYIHEGGEFICGNGLLAACGYTFGIFGQGKLSIGEDCMISWGVSIITHDGHAIFDRETKKRINAFHKGLKKYTVEIEDHVWIGAQAIILYGSHVGSGSIVGAGSFVKGDVPEGCEAVGRPAHVVRENIVWTKDNNADCFPDICEN